MWFAYRSPKYVTKSKANGADVWGMVFVSGVNGINTGWAFPHSVLPRWFQHSVHLAYENS